MGGMLHKHGTFVIMDERLTEIRVHNTSTNGTNGHSWNLIEIASLDAINTAVNLAYAEHQVALDEQNKGAQRQQQSARATIAFHRNSSHSTSVSSSRVKRPNSIASPPADKHSISTVSARTTLISQHTQRLTPPRKVTPPPPPAHLSPSNRKQQEMNMLDFSDPETPKNVHHFFNDNHVQRNHGSRNGGFQNHIHTTQNPKQPSRSKSTDINFDEIFASFAEHRHEAHIKRQHQSWKSTNNLLEHIQQKNSPPKRTVASLTQVQYGSPASPVSTISSQSPASPVIVESENGSRIRRRVNYPRKSDLELMKTIHRAQIDLSKIAEQQQPDSKIIGSSSALNEPARKLHPETFEINESEMLDFDFADADEEEYSAGLTKQESFEDLTRELDEMLAQIGVSNAEVGVKSPSHEISRVNPVTGSPVPQPKPSSNQQQRAVASPVLNLDQKLAKIIQEIFKEESTFVKSLETLQKTFVVPLKQQGIISESLHHLVFSDFPVIYNIHQPMMEHMKKLFDSVKNELSEQMYPEYSEDFLSKFIGIIQNKAPAFKLYTRFFSQMSNMLSSLKEEQEQNEAFREFLTSAQKNLRQEQATRQTLTAYLQQILQHLARYPLILQRLSDNAPPTASYLLKLQSLTEQIKATLRHCNQRKTDEDMQDLIVELEKELNMQLHKRGRRLIKHGVITRTKPTKRYSVHLYLFNDLIIMKDLRKGISKQPPKVLKIHHNLRVGRLGSQSFFIFDCFYQKNQALTLFFECEKDDQCEEWVKISTSIIKNRKRLIKSKLKNAGEEYQTE
eukprot:CAMPEP_0117436372 /NCGR_PEP_ID=MMETSP0759-20121206/973_1 /TAXON_ID=63605 /ORGANISM="Percolomonas cosmopolitus, Strain WS" /LENGTH=789 /DNA_ID=CAMNT_0005227969 /DNA_START=383 /DNA_END=2752 /DNA_ORIENTATION=+